MKIGPFLAEICPKTWNFESGYPPENRRGLLLGEAPLLENLCYIAVYSLIKVPRGVFTSIRWREWNSGHFDWLWPKTLITFVWGPPRNQGTPLLENLWSANALPLLNLICKWPLTCAQSIVSTLKALVYWVFLCSITTWNKVFNAPFYIMSWPTHSNDLMVYREHMVLMMNGCLAT